MEDIASVILLMLISSRRRRGNPVGALAVHSLVYFWRGQKQAKSEPTDTHIYTYFFSTCNTVLLLCQHSKARLACGPTALMLKAFVSAGTPSVSPEIQRKVEGIDVVPLTLQEASSWFTQPSFKLSSLSVFKPRYYCYALCKGIISPSVPSSAHVCTRTTSWHCR